MQACIPPVRRVQLTFSACTITLGHRDTILPHFMISSVVPVANSCQRRKSSSLMGMSTDSWPLSVDDRDRSTSRSPWECLRVQTTPGTRCESHSVYVSIYQGTNGWLVIDRTPRWGTHEI